MRNSLRVFGNRRYSTWMAAELIASVAGWILFTVQLWLVMTALDVPKTEQAALAGLLLVFQFLPQAFLSAVAGWLSDRIPRRWILVSTQVGLAVVACVGGAYFLSGSGSVALLFILALVSGTISAFDWPTKQAAAADYVDSTDRREAIVGLSIVSNVSRLIGPALAGFLIVAIGAPSALIVTGVLFTVAGIVLFILPSVQPLPIEAAPKRGEALRILRAKPTIIVAIVAGFFVGALACHTSLMMTSLVLEQDLNADSFSALSFVLALGTLLGATLCMKLPLTLKSLLIASLGVGAAMILVSRLDDFALVTGGFFIFGLMLGSANTLTTTFVQISAPPESMGRIVGIYFMIFGGIAPLSAPLLGYIIDTYSVGTLMLLSGTTILLVMTVLLILRQRFRARVRVRV